MADFSKILNNIKKGNGKESNSLKTEDIDFVIGRLESSDPEMQLFGIDYCFKALSSQNGKEILEYGGIGVFVDFVHLAVNGVQFDIQSLSIKCLLLCIDKYSYENLEPLSTTVFLDFLHNSLCNIQEIDFLNICLKILSIVYSDSHEVREYFTYEKIMSILDTLPLEANSAEFFSVYFQNIGDVKEAHYPLIEYIHNFLETNNPDNISQALNSISILITKQAYPFDIDMIRDRVYQFLRSDDKRLVIGAFATLETFYPVKSSDIDAVIECLTISDINSSQALTYLKRKFEVLSDDYSDRIIEVLIDNLNSFSYNGKRSAVFLISMCLNYVSDVDSRIIGVLAEYLTDKIIVHDSISALLRIAQKFSNTKFEWFFSQMIDYINDIEAIVSNPKVETSEAAELLLKILSGQK